MELLLLLTKCIIVVALSQNYMQDHLTYVENITF